MSVYPKSSYKFKTFLDKTENPKKEKTNKETTEPRHEKTCLRVFDQVRLKIACSAKETS